MINWIFAIIYGYVSVESLKLVNFFYAENAYLLLAVYLPLFALAAERSRECVVRAFKN